MVVFDDWFTRFDHLDWSSIINLKHPRETIVLLGGTGYMDEHLAEYDPRYLAGIVLFNQGDFFEAHEVWEELWIDMAGPEKQFFQGLIQAAVALCHFCNGNLAGARKVYISSHKYMQKYLPELHGLDIEQFWQDMNACFEQVLEAEAFDKPIPIVEELIPEIHINPAPESWPDPDEYLPDEDH